jgi:ATP-binding protein involved in chromosome partitioning
MCSSDGTAPAGSSGLIPASPGVWACAWAQRPASLSWHAAPGSRQSVFRSVLLRKSTAEERSVAFDTQLAGQLLNVLNDQIRSLPIPNTAIALSAVATRVEVALDEQRAAIALTLGFPLSPELSAALRTDVAALVSGQGLTLASLQLTQRIVAHAVQPGVAGVPMIRNIIAVGSGKGGVGKSTTAVNLALALAGQGARVGLLDADVYGPSIPMMLGLSGRPDSPDGKMIEPMHAHGIEAMSIRLMVEQDTPMIWRGPMATSALTQLLTQTLWGGPDGLGLDYLIVDLPPGTGDIQLTLAQKIPVAGAVIVTTPQDVATLDARKALKMFEKV